MKHIIVVMLLFCATLLSAQTAAEQLRACANHMNDLAMEAELAATADIQADVLTRFLPLLDELITTSYAMDATYPNLDTENLPPELSDMEDITHMMVVSMLLIYQCGSANSQDSAVAAAYKAIDAKMQELQGGQTEDSGE